MRTVEVHAYSYTNHFGKRAKTRHKLEPGEALKQLGPDAVPIPSTREVREYREPGDPPVFNTTAGWNSKPTYPGDIQGKA